MKKLTALACAAALLFAVGGAAVADDDDDDDGTGSDFALFDGTNPDNLTPTITGRTGVLCGNADDGKLEAESFSY